MTAVSPLLYPIWDWIMCSASTMVNNVYTVHLTEHHKHLLCSAHHWAHSQLLHSHGSYSTSQLVGEIVECFNSWHVKAVRAGTPCVNEDYMKPYLVEQ